MLVTPILVTRNETDADKEWTSCAIKNRHDITVYSYNNPNGQIFMRALKGGTTSLQIIPHDQGYKNYLMKACNDIGVDYPSDKDNSFKRDYHLIRDVDSLYFTGYFDTNVKSRLQIKGRDAWLVEMFVNKIGKPESGPYPIYMFSEDMKCWCQLAPTLKWIYIMRAPKPNGRYLAFGTDPISHTAKIELNLI